MRTRWPNDPGTLPTMDVTVPGGTLWAEDTGGEETPVVLVHGDWTDSRLWEPLVALLRDRFRVIRYDWRGFGRSSRPSAPYSRTADLEALLGTLGVKHAIVAGYSGGAGITLSLTLDHPERTGALVLIAPGCQDYPWPREDPYFKECQPLMTAADRDGLVRFGARVMAPAGTSDVITAMFGSAVSSWSEIGGLEQEDPPVFGRLGEIRVPAAMLLGDREYPMVADASHAIAARIDGCQTIVVPGADHMLPLRAPELVANAIADVADQSI